MLTLTMLLPVIVNWKTPDPIQGFDRWEPAALFTINEVFGDRYVDEGPNHDKLGVKNTGSVLIRSYLEFDLQAIPDDFDRITLNILITNIDSGPPVEVVEFFHYTGDGERNIEDWDVGTLSWIFDHPYPVVEKYRIKLDVTELVREYRGARRRYLGFRLSAPEFARFSIGKTVAINDPNPFFAIHHEGARTDSSDLESFTECMFGPEDLYAARCPLLWDYNDDEHVDLADFAIFQAMFDE